MDLVKAVLDDHVRIGIVNNILQFIDDLCEFNHVNVCPIKPLDNVKIRESVQKEQDRDLDLKAMIDFKLTGVLPIDPTIAQSVQTQKDDFIVYNGALHRDNPKNENQGLRSLPNSS